MFTEPVQTRVASRVATRAAVVHAAGTLFTSQGFGSTTIRDIAAAAGVSVGTVMSVADKDGLLVEIVDARIAEAQRQPQTGRHGTAAQADGAVDATAVVLGILRDFVAIFAADVDLARAFTAILVSGRHASVIFDELATTLEEAIAAALVQTGRTAEHARALARIIYRAYLGELFIWAGSGAPDPVHALGELETTVRAILDESRV